LNLSLVTDVPDKASLFLLLILKLALFFKKGAMLV